MNRIKKLKIENYKKKLLERHKSIGVNSVSHIQEKTNDVEFCKSAHNKVEGCYFRFSIFDFDKNSYIDEPAITNKTNDLISINLFHFNDCDNLTFVAEYGEEQFLVCCDASKFIERYPFIEGISNQPMLFSNDHSVLLSLMRLEYEIELYVFVQRETIK